MQEARPQAGEVQFLWPTDEAAIDMRPAVAGTGRTQAAALIIIPTYNERENLPRLVHEILGTEPTLEILFVDDRSPDGTGELADRLADETDRVHVMHRAGKMGLGTAYVAGFKYALNNGYDYILQMDADFSHRPQDLPRLLQAAETADVVIGSRNVPGGQTLDWSPLRGLISKGGSLYSRLLLRLPVRDCTGGFKCFRRRALEVLDLDHLNASGFGFQVEVNYALARAGMRFAEVPIIFPNRANGKSKMSSHIMFEAALLVLRLATGLTPAPLCEEMLHPAPSGSGSPTA